MDQPKLVDTESEIRLRIENRFPDMEAALDALEAALEARDASFKFVYRSRLILEELLTNTIKYGYDDDEIHVIDVTLRLSTPATMRIEDDGHPFDPTKQAPEVDLEASIEERPIGGLGLFMVRQETASMHYQRLDNRNRLDLVFLD